MAGSFVMFCLAAMLLVRGRRRVIQRRRRLDYWRRMAQLGETDGSE